MFTRFLLILALSVAVASSNSADGAIPQTINYQGRLTTSTANPVPDGPYLIKFSIYSTPTGGSPLWTTDYQTVQVTDGLFDVRLGEAPMTPLPSDLFSSNTVRYLEIKVGIDSAIAPRTPFTSVPYCYQALRADSAGNSEHADTASHAVWAGGADTALHVDTTAFSAYLDLTSELRIGTESNQVAAGNHNHVISGLQYQNLDTTYAELSFTGEPEVFVKTLTIPANTVHHFFRISTSVYAYSAWARVYINQQKVYEKAGPATCIADIMCVRQDSSEFVASSIGSSDYSITLNPSEPIVVYLIGKSDGGSSRVGFGTVTLWYGQ